MRISIVTLIKMHSLIINEGIMGSCASFAMGTMQEADINKVNGVCAHTLGEACN